MTKLYGVGVGPGDPELMTLKAVRAIRECDVIAIPGSGQKINAAYTIVKKAVPEVEEKELAEIPMPMTRDSRKLEESHRAGTEQITAYLDQGKSVAFLTLGDPSVYSTYMYIHHRIVSRGYAAEMIPGIPSFCAAAARPVSYTHLDVYKRQEMALQADLGCVYAIESNGEAADLVLENKKKMGASNLHVIRGTAPQALEDLPPADKAFIGGSRGNLRSIIQTLLKKNPAIRIVINAIALETLAEAVQIFREEGFAYTDVVQITASRAKAAGSHHLMMGQNPVFILTGEKKEAESCICLLYTSRCV